MIVPEMLCFLQFNLFFKNIDLDFSIECGFTCIDQTDFNMSILPLNLFIEHFINPNVSENKQTTIYLFKL